MKTDLHIQNFGKVKSADIHLRPFTVIVGPNSSGKSFITKALYSIFHSMNKDFGTDFLISSVEDSFRWTYIIENRIPRISQKDILLFTELRSILSKLQFFINDINEDITILDTSRIASIINELYIPIQDSYAAIKDQLNTGVGSKFKAVEDEMRLLEMDIKNIKLFVDEGDSVYISRFKNDLKQEFLENFQVQSLSALYSQNEENIFDFSDFGRIQLKNQNIDFNLHRDSIAELQQLYNVVYLESPIYFKLKNALRGVRLSNASFRRKGFLNQVPKYFYDVDQLLEAKISGDLSNEFSAILNKIENCIHGSLNISNGEISRYYVAVAQSPKID